MIGQFWTLRFGPFPPCGALGQPGKTFLRGLPTCRRELVCATQCFGRDAESFVNPSSTSAASAYLWGLHARYIFSIWGQAPTQCSH